MVVEVRRRLGAVNIYIPNCDLESSITISPEGNEIRWIEKSSKKEVRLDWPCDSLGKLSCDSLHNLVKNSANESAFFRIRLQQENPITLISVKDVQKNVKKPFRLPCGLSSAIKNSSTSKSSSSKKAVKLICSRCQSKVLQMTIRRLLPLPSIDWKGGALDWFCTCHHPDEDCNSSAVFKSDEGKKKEVSEAAAASTAQLLLLSNNKLHEKSLEPNNAQDILYSTSFILLSDKLFDEFPPFRPPPSSDNTILKCKSCLSVIGELQIKQNCVRIWHHSLTSLNDDEEAEKEREENCKVDEIPNKDLTFAEETFLLLIGGICMEHDWMPIKIKLKTSRSIKGHDGGEKVLLSLFIWIMEPNLHLATFDDKLKAHQQEVMKVMFIENSEDSNAPPSDQEIEVPEDVIEKGLKHLQLNQSLIPQTQRNDHDFQISYINLNSVLL